METVSRPCNSQTELMLSLVADYTLIWDQRFVQPLKVHEPMDYTAPHPIRVDKVTQSDLNEVNRSGDLSAIR